MNELNTINISGVECYEQNGTAYLKLETVARGLGFTQEKNGIEYVRWDRIEGYLLEMGFPHKWGKNDFIPENIFYRLAMKAKNEVAEKFQAKVADEIIPSIRKTGGYQVKAPQGKELLALAVLEAQKTIEAQTAQIEEMRPHATLGQAVTSSDTSISVSDMAKILRQNGINIGGLRLFNWLRDNGYLIKRKGTDWNMPTQRSIEMGLFEIKESVHIDGNGCNKTTRTPKVTGKGQLYFVNKFINKAAIV